MVAPRPRPAQTRSPVGDGHEARVDGRREAGERTRRRLIEAAQDLLAERAEASIRLRELTAVAGANLESVHYHFGSLRALLHVAQAEAVEHVVDAQIAELGDLGVGPSVHAIAAAYLRPVVRGLVPPGVTGRPHARVLARMATDPPAELSDWMAATIGRAHDHLLERMAVALPDVPAAELAFRVKCVGGIIVVLSGWALEPDVEGRTAEQIEALLTPSVAGALTGA